MTDQGFIAQDTTAHHLDITDVRDIIDEAQNIVD